MLKTSLKVDKTLSHKSALGLIHLSRNHQMTLRNLKKDFWQKMNPPVTHTLRPSLSTGRLPTANSIVEAVRSSPKSSQVEATERRKWALNIVWKRKMNTNWCNDRNFWIKLNQMGQVWYKVVKGFIWWILIRDKLAVKIQRDIPSIISLCKIVKLWPLGHSISKAFRCSNNNKIKWHRIIGTWDSKYPHQLVITTLMATVQCPLGWSVNFKPNNRWTCPTLIWWLQRKEWDNASKLKYLQVQIN